MKAMVLRAPGAALALDPIDAPEPLDGQLVLQVRACGVCRTDLHVIDGELEHPKLPLLPGHGTSRAGGVALHVRHHAL